MNLQKNNINMDNVLILIDRFDNKDLILKILKRFNKETKLHSIRVALIMEEYLNTFSTLSKESKDIYILGMLLHDTGKIYVPNRILEKKGKLTEREMSIVRKHTNDGYNLLKSTNVDKIVLDTVRYHHERLNGTGYYGLKKNEIPEIGKIAAIIDVYDAITQPRCYNKNVCTLDKAITILLGDKGLDKEYCEDFINFIVNKDRHIKKSV